MDYKWKRYKASFFFGIQTIFVLFLAMLLARQCRVQTVYFAQSFLSDKREAYSTERQFLKKSFTFDTYKYQAALPLLPIPKLSKTIEHYLDCVEPLVRHVFSSCLFF